MIFGAKVAKKIHSAFNPPIFLTISILTYIERSVKTSKKAEKSVNNITQTEGQQSHHSPLDILTESNPPPISPTTCRKPLYATAGHTPERGMCFCHIAATAYDIRIATRTTQASAWHIIGERICRG